ncbi:alpha/beta fold hydrolase [Actinoplanes sp. LDG1-06]|uniref:Alpha/beta fold hydrolase n=1 Tax=Paractinoplanes ovalisporus TaxID=2810368 RepID=A0ABS2ATU0_9ACTN|nr:alpha/beta fold hydrolase [Actinoplanes ovalisporus]MBM2623140.1 alpha/beta fold hydrolase [Actinoplanes ovalisporus]
MPTAILHDGSTIEVQIQGSGPAILAPVSTRLIEGEQADTMRAWGADPHLGHTLATGLAEAGFRVVTADYEGHLNDHPAPLTLTADAVAADLLAIADAGGADRFAYYGYSWLALSGLQLALRTDRLTALAMGGFPPIDGPYEAMLAVTKTAHRMALDPPPPPAGEATPGDWDSVAFTQTPDQTRQFVTLYESLRGFDDSKVRLDIPRLAFAGANDNIRYGEAWDNAYVALAEPLKTHESELTTYGWEVQVIPDADHMVAMQAAQVLPILIKWLRSSL